MVISSNSKIQYLKAAVSKLLESAYDFNYQEKYEIACSLVENALKLVPDSGHNNSTEIKFNMISCLGGIRNMILNNFLDDIAPIVVGGLNGHSSSHSLRHL